MMRYSVILFDLDGTILNTLDDLAASTNRSLAKNGLPTRSTEEVRRFVGNGIRLLIERAVPSNTPLTLTDRVFDDFRADYAEHCADRTLPYDGIPELLRALRASGARTAVISNKADSAVQELIAHYFPGLFDAVVGERPGVRRKAFTGEGATFAMNELQPHHEPRPHKHPYEQIAYIAAGVCDYHIEDQVFRLTPGGMLVIPPNLMHYAEVVGDEVLVNFDIFTPKREEYVK